MTNTEAIQKLAAQIAAEKDPEKQKAIKAELVAKINEEKAARKAAEDKAAQGPMYPQGLVVKFGKRTATITQAVKNAQGEWFYAIDLLAGEILELGDGEYQLTESEMRAKVQEEVGVVQPGQAFTAGMAVYRNGQGGLIQKVEKNAAGQWTYVVQGWGGPVTYLEFMGILMRS